MQLNLHANATTTPKTRAYIQTSTASAAELAAELGVHLKPSIAGGVAPPPRTARTGRTAWPPACRRWSRRWSLNCAACSLCRSTTSPRPCDAASIPNCRAAPMPAASRHQPHAQTRQAQARPLRGGRGGIYTHRSEAFAGAATAQILRVRRHRPGDPRGLYRDPSSPRPPPPSCSASSPSSRQPCTPSSQITAPSSPTASPST